MEKFKGSLQGGNNDVKAKYFKVLDWEGTLEITFEMKNKGRNRELDTFQSELPINFHIVSLVQFH